MLRSKRGDNLQIGEKNSYVRTTFFSLTIPYSGSSLGRPSSPYFYIAVYIAYVPLLPASPVMDEE
jgi:hypothetical protein